MYIIYTYKLYMCIIYIYPHEKIMLKQYEIRISWTLTDMETGFIQHKEN
jgi:hypothetical protein